VVLATDLTGGRQGLSGIFNPTMFGIPLKFTGFYLLSGAITLLWLLGMRNFVDSRYGRALLVLRESRQLTQSLGLSPYKMRIRSYLIGSIPAGAAGTLYAYLVGFVSPEAFTLNLAIAVLAAAVVGGTSSVWGAAVGSAILVLGPLQSSAFEQYSILTYGIFLLIAGLAFASGIAGLARNAVNKFGGALGKLHVLQQARLLKNVKPDDGAVVIPGQLLVADGVSKAFGGVKALDGAAITAEPGKITAILGSNGAGKTTLLNTISGFVIPDAGTITVGETSLIGLSADRIGQRGVGRTFQTPQIPHGMNVLDVVESGRFHQGPGLLASIMRLPSYRKAQRENRMVALAALRFAGLEHLIFEDAPSLPLGTRRLLEVVRAVAREPNLLLLDEPAAGLDDVGLAELAQLVRRIRDAGGTVIIVEHNVPFVMDLADEVHVMELGRTIASGTPVQIAHDPAVIASYLGEALTAQADLEELR
jgi:branched-chain amino acid transport system permease protein